MSEAKPAEQKKGIFTDLRYIRACELGRDAPDGSRLPVVNPSSSPVRASAVTEFVPYGVRLIAQPAKKSETPIMLKTSAGTSLFSCSLVVLEDGRYRGWRFRSTYLPGRDLRRTQTLGRLLFILRCDRQICLDLNGFNLQ